ncbi:hypothetical protein IRZ83_18795 [Flavobacterium sp. JLP]|uniref:matrixin family metalloprotease n=1 Tax=unclassified Flavobacterium TaxID=196869 RepID=UPI00188A98E3|nr:MULTISPECIES: matrixin family metalloprotease [unclassified Flavobacterium]MBF4494387.1 hypothetical protein [Flavobacterium sp. MR2016-29]MBF4508727.1 hypothetical protein [Flavobacterium sp. JLP]
MKKLKLAIVSFIFVISSCDQNNKDFPYSDENKITVCTYEFHQQNNATEKPDAAIITWPRWNPGQIVKIKFLNGNAALEDKVKEFASEWTIYANIKFEYVPVNEYADIRISFRWKNDGSSWSVLGMNSTNATTNYQNEPSMNFGWTTLGNDTATKREVLHEFGHALGLIHEHQSPAANIPWNLPKVYKYYSDLMGWSKEEVDENVLYSSEQTNYTEYDSLSIMNYYIDPSLRTDGVRNPINDDLSITDMTFINHWYPFPIRSSIESGERIDFIPWTNAIRSANGKYMLKFESGLLHIFDLANNTIIWEAGDRRYNYSTSCYLEPNGNLVIKGTTGGVGGSPERITWSSNTAEFSGAILQLQDDGNLELIYKGVVKWSSKMGKI